MERLGPSWRAQSGATVGTWDAKGGEHDGDPKAVEAQRLWCTQTLDCLASCVSGFVHLWCVSQLRGMYTVQIYTHRHTHES